eukprot:gene20479-24537_t
MYFYSERPEDQKYLECCKNEEYRTAEKKEDRTWWISYFDNWAEIELFPAWLKWSIPNTRNLTTVTFEGPSIVHFQVYTPLGEIRLLKTILPQAPFLQYSEDRWYAAKSTPQWLIWIVSTVAKNKIYNQRPILVSGDGPFTRYRKWYNQFYTESSKGYGETSEW